jgi:AraC-like DNA-binding protein
VQSGRLRLPADLAFGVEGVDDEPVMTTVLHGGVGYDCGTTTVRGTRGDVHLSNAPGWRLSTDTHDLHAQTTILGCPSSPRRSVPPPRPGPSCPCARCPVPSGAARWRATSRFVGDLLAEPEVAAAPLLLGPAARLLAGTALTVFPNTLVSPPAPADRTDAHPVTLRRAIASIESACDSDIGLADIARAASVTPRAVQLAFRRHLGTTPTAYLRQVRLAQAHRERRDAAPGGGVTVTDVAARWAFTPSRFTERYRAAYGVLPSQTLRL